MGSFATSLHVKSSSPADVAAALAEILAADGWLPAEPPPDAGMGHAQQPANRAIQISAESRGWVSVLDSDMAGSQATVLRLAQRLAAPALFCYVNDSDSWGYFLADEAGLTSEFESDEQESDDEAGGDLVNAADAIGKLNALMQNGSILAQMQDMQTRISAAAPPEVRAAEERIKTGRGSAADIQQYQAWAMQEMPKHLGQMRSLLGGLLGPAGSIPGGDQEPSQAKKSAARPSRAERAVWKRRLDALRPLLAPGVTDEQVQEVCQRQAIFAEEVLAAFLKLLGITDFYAHLSYDYLDESGPEELAAYQIRFVHHLHFTTAHPATIGGAPGAER